VFERGERVFEEFSSLSSPDDGDDGGQERRGVRPTSSRQQQQHGICDGGRYSAGGWQREERGECMSSAGNVKYVTKSPIESRYHQVLILSTFWLVFDKTKCNGCQHRCVKEVY
jgi:hypothetical protein